MQFGIVSLLLLICAVVAHSYSVGPYGSHQLARREVGGEFGDFVSELKGKAMGGRMRFGKRSGPTEQEQALPRIPLAYVVY